MGRHQTSATGPGQITKWVSQRIERGGERLWRFEDFRDVPVSAVAQALSRLSRQGKLERLSKGVYYRARQTALGKSAGDAVSGLGRLWPRRPASAVYSVEFQRQACCHVLSSLRHWKQQLKQGHNQQTNKPA